MSNLGFVILHFKTADDTRACVESIRQHVPGAHVVVVDNGSGNGSGKLLASEYKADEDVRVILEERNLGFARGNNVGIKVARSIPGVRFVVVLNNDTKLLQDDFEKLVNDEYAQSQFAVLGPQIETRDGKVDSSPAPGLITSRQQALKLIYKRMIKYALCLAHLEGLVKEAGTGKMVDVSYDYNCRYEDVKLHGACLIFSDKYFERYEGFCDKTFLYFEEDILYWRAKQTGLKMVYNPNLRIWHAEDSSTNSTVKNKREKNLFVFKNEIKSLRVLKDILNDSSME